MISPKHYLLALTVLTSCALSGCNNRTTMLVDPDDPAPTGDFELRSTDQTSVLIEGDNAGITIPINLVRNNDHSRNVELQISGRTEADVAFVTSRFSRLTLTPSEDQSSATLKLAIGSAPIQPQQRDFIITASDGIDSDSLPLSVIVQPTSAPDVYLLAGQSNMVGFSGDGTRRSESGGPDEPNERIKQLNVSKNDQFEVFLSDADYTSEEVNIVAPDIITALDPLHVPQGPNTDSSKEHEYIGLGLSFAKSALVNTTADILLIPAAWSGSSFCSNDNGPAGNWVARPSSNPDRGNSLLFERAVLRANAGIQQSGGVLRGILWHQGESDSNERCAALYSDNVIELIDQFRERIMRVGNPQLNAVDTPIPFVLGTMSRGVEENDDFSVYNEPKQMIDDIHRNLPSITNNVALSNHDDLVPANGFPCGNGCVHFGPSALREMGVRYYEALIRALAP